MIRIAAIALACSLPALGANAVQIAAWSTLAVNVVSIDQTAIRVWKVIKASKRVTVKAAKKVAGK